MASTILSLLLLWKKVSLNAITLRRAFQKASSYHCKALRRIHLRQIMDRTKTKIDIKNALADKCERLALSAGSAAKRTKYNYDATRYRRQAEQMKREAAGN